MFSKNRTRRPSGRSAGRSDPVPALLEALEGRALLNADLGIATVAMPEPAAGTPVNPGQDILVRVTINNISSSTDAGAFDVQIRLTKNTVIGDGDDIVIDTWRQNGLPRGNVEPLLDAVIIPEDVPNGRYYIAAVVDSAGEVTEGNESNNSRRTSMAVLQIGPDEQPGETPDIVVIGNGNTIAHNDLQPRLADHTGFGRVGVNGRIRERTFTIRNDGDGTLNITQVQLRGSNNFTIVSGPGDTSLEAGESTTFTVRFDPDRTRARNGRVEITTDDPDTGVYRFKINGRGVAANVGTPVEDGEPDIAVSGRGQEIANGDTRPAPSDHTAFGGVRIDQSRQRTYTITNNGDGDLTLSGDFVSLTGRNRNQFSIVSFPSSVIAPGTSATFTIAFNPGSPGRKIAFVNIFSDDPTDPTYTFRIAGTGRPA